MIGIALLFICLTLVTVYFVLGKDRVKSLLKKSRHNLAGQIVIGLFLVALVSATIFILFITVSYFNLFCQYFV